MQLLLQNPFTLEIPNGTKKDEIIKGTLRSLTKKEQKEFEDIFKEDQNNAKSLQKKNKKMARLAKSIELGTSTDYDALYEIQDEIEVEVEALQDLDTQETTAKKRFEMCVKSPKIDKLTELCETYSYRLVIDTIAKDIEEKKNKGTQTS